MESMGLAAGVYAGETCDMLMPPVNRLLSVHTFVLDEIDPDGYVAYLFRRSVDRAEPPHWSSRALRNSASVISFASSLLRSLSKSNPNHHDADKRYCMDDGVDATL